MQSPWASPRRRWRAIIGCLAAYALAFNTVLLAMLSAQSAAAGAPSGGLGLEFCLTAHDGLPADAQAGPPDQAPGHHEPGQIHCTLCVAAGSGSILPPSAPVATFLAGRSSRLSPLRQLGRVAAFDFAIFQPRGPPLA